MKTYNPKDRAAKKQRQRDQDEKDLADGKVTRKEMRNKNSLFPENISRDGKIVVRDQFE